jgi:hypothetical protein
MQLYPVQKYIEIKDARPLESNLKIGSVFSSTHVGNRRVIWDTTRTKSSGNDTNNILFVGFDGSYVARPSGHAVNEYIDATLPLRSHL